MPIPTVASLCRRLGADLVPAPGFTAPDDVVTAVHVSELLDPTVYLGGGELLLTTGMSLPANRIGCEKYVGRLERAGIAALALGLGPVHDEPPGPLVAACRKAGLPLLTVPAPTPFLRITRAYWAAVASTVEQQLQDVLAAQRALVEAAASADPVHGVLRALSRALDGWAATFAPDGEVEQVHPPGLVEDVARVRGDLARLRGVHSAASFSSGDSAVLVYPLAVGERTAGYLAVGTARPLDAHQRRPVLTATALLSIEAVRRQGAESAVEASERCVALLVDLGLPGPARRLASEVGAPVPTERVHVLALRSRDSGEAAAAVRRWCRAVLGLTADRHSAWFLVPEEHPPLEHLDAALATDPSTTAAMSDVVTLDQVPAVRVVQTTSVVSLPSGSRLLPARTVLDPALVDRLATAVGTMTEPLLTTLTAYLRHRGQWEGAARDLGVHRNTVRHRILRCEQVLDARLDDPDVAAELWLLLRRRRLA